MQPHEIREARAALGLTQQGLADALELDSKHSAATVRGWEAGRNPISGPAKVAIRLMLTASRERRALEAIRSSHPKNSNAHKLAAEGLAEA